MLRRDRVIRMQVQELIDACLFMFSFWLAYVLRSSEVIINFFGLHEISAESFDRYLSLYLVIPFAPLVLESVGFYNRPLVCRRRVTAWVLFKGCLVATLGLTLALVMFRLDLARWVVVLFGFISFGLIYIKEDFLQRFIRSKVGEEQYRRRFVLVGTAEEARRLRSELRAKSSEPIDIVGQTDLNEEPVGHLVNLLHEHSINGVIISAKSCSFEQVDAAINACELEGVEVWLVADFFKAQLSRTTLDELCGQPILVFSTAPEASWQGVLKQVCDYVGAALLLVLSSPVLLAVALLVKVSSPGPVFFRQQRSGLNGRPFTLYKFRTMVSNAEQLKHELAALNEMTGPVFKVTNDPRVTPVGRVLRKFSIDEFPQLFNVLRGQMSLVGPRPLPVDEVRRFHDLAHRRRLSVKPGLTCLWQISGRNNVKDFRDWVRLDLEYIDNWSLWLDFKILCRTVPVVLVGTGAK